MINKEELEQLAYDEGVPVDYWDFSSDRLCGIYVDGSIAIKAGMSTPKTADTLAEELGHHFTTAGNIIEMQDITDIKQERAARLWAYNKRIGLSGIIDAFKAQCANTYEVAEYLSVSEEFLRDALEQYRQIYGAGTMVDNYYIQFEPNLQVFSYHLVD